MGQYFGTDVGYLSQLSISWSLRPGGGGWSAVFSCVVSHCLFVPHYWSFLANVRSDQSKIEQKILEIKLLDEMKAFL